jgi:hypothetical protein
MRSLLLALVLLALALLAAAPAAGQAPPPVRLPAATVAEWQARTVTWRGYDGRTRTATATVYGNEAADRADRPYTVVLADDATNREPISADARFLADLVGRELSVDPVRLAFLFRFALEGEGRRPLTVRATVRRSSAGRLVSPSWRVLSSEEVEDYTAQRRR